MPNGFTDRWATWNMQGAGGDDENKWNAYVKQLLDRHHAEVVALQEAGAPPPTGQPAEVIHRRTADGVVDIARYEWDTGTRNRPSPHHVYHMVNDPAAGRVNLALVTDNRADAVYLARPGFQWSRPSLGLRFDQVVYWTVHAIARNHGGDAPRLLRKIRSQAGPRRWIAAGDFNRTPLIMAQGVDAGMRIGSSGQVTRPASGLELDYMVGCRLPADVNAQVLHADWSDHRPVIFSWLPG